MFDMEGILGGLGSISSDEPSLVPGEALRFFELARDVVECDAMTEALSICFFSKRDDLLVAAGVEATMLIVSLGWTFSSNKEEFDPDVNVLEGSVLLRTLCDDVVGNDDDCIGIDADRRIMILLRLISPRVPIRTGEERNSFSSSCMISSLLLFDSESNSNDVSILLFVLLLLPKYCLESPLFSLRDPDEVEENKENVVSRSAGLGGRGKLGPFFFLFVTAAGKLLLSTTLVVASLSK
jgi:hypothetical protein